MLLHKEKLLSASALFVSLCIPSVTGLYGTGWNTNWFFMLSLCFIAITGSLWMSACCGSGVQAKGLLLLPWLKDHEMGMDVCSWLVCMHKNANQKLLYFMHLPLSSERLFVICNFLLRNVPPAFLIPDCVPWSRERCPRKSGNLKKCWVALSFSRTFRSCRFLGFLSFTGATSTSYCTFLKLNIRISK